MDPPKPYLPSRRELAAALARLPSAGATAAQLDEWIAPPPPTLMLDPKPSIEAMAAVPPRPGPAALPPPLVGSPARYREMARQEMARQEMARQEMAHLALAAEASARRMALEIESSTWSTVGRSLPSTAASLDALYASYLSPRTPPTLLGLRPSLSTRIDDLRAHALAHPQVGALAPLSSDEPLATAGRLAARSAALALSGPRPPSLATSHALARAQAQARIGASAAPSAEPYDAWRSPPRGPAPFPAPRAAAALATPALPPRVPKLRHKPPRAFPVVLFDVVSCDGLSDIVSWLPHGRGFLVHDKRRFEREVLPRHFDGAKFTSFTRRLKRWNFVRVPRGKELG